MRTVPDSPLTRFARACVGGAAAAPRVNTHARLCTASARLVGGNSGAWQQAGAPNFTGQTRGVPATRWPHNRQLGARLAANSEEHGKHAASSGVLVPYVVSYLLGKSQEQVGRARAGGSAETATACERWSRSRRDQSCHPSFAFALRAIRQSLVMLCSTSIGLWLRNLRASRGQCLLAGRCLEVRQEPGTSGRRASFISVQAR